MFNQFVPVTPRTCYGYKDTNKFVYMKSNGERIAHIISEFCESKADFARKVGEKPQTISNWVARNNGMNVLNKIIEVFPEINMDWLMTGHGEMLRNNKNEATTKEGTNYRLVPIIHIDSVGGMRSNNSITSELQYIEGYVPFVNAHEGDRAIFQSGTSMIPTIPPGSIMQIREVVNWKDFFGYGNIFVIELKDGRRITKEVRRYDENPREYVWCVSHNPDVQDEELPKSMITSVWKVIKVLTDKGW